MLVTQKEAFFRYIYVRQFFFLHLHIIGFCIYKSIIIGLRSSKSLICVSRNHLFLCAIFCTHHFGGSGRAMCHAGRVECIASNVHTILLPSKIWMGWPDLGQNLHKFYIQFHPLAKIWVGWAGLGQNL